MAIHSEQLYSYAVTSVIQLTPKIYDPHLKIGSHSKMGTV